MARRRHGRHGARPVFGPLIASASSWRQLFIADALLMLVAVGIGAHSMKESRDEDSVFTVALLLPTLLLGLGLLSPYLALLIAKEHLASWPLSAVIVVSGVACLLGFFVLNRRSSHPLFDTNIVGHNRRMWLTDLFGAIHVGALFVVVAAFPVILQADTGLSAAGIGLGMLALRSLDHVAPARPSFPRAIRTHPPERDIDGVHLIVLSMVWWFAAASRHPMYVMVLPSLLLMGSGFGMIRLFGHMESSRRQGSAGHPRSSARTFSNHVGAAVGAIVIGFVLPATSMHVLSHHPQIAERAGIVAGVAVAVVVVSSAARSRTSSSALRIRRHKAKAPSLDGQK